LPGFGSGPFGSDTYGSFDWARQVLYRDLPELDRSLDAEEQSERLRKWTEVEKYVFDELLGFASDFEQLRDPDSVRTQFQDKLTVSLLSATVTSSGRLIEVLLDDPDPSDPFNPLGRTSIGWILTDREGKQFTVNSVHKLRDAGPTIEVVGRAILPLTEADGVGLGAATLRPPSLITFLGADYGVEVDQYEPEVFQRSSVRNACQWYSIKGTARAYDVLGKIAGYRVTPLGLWRVPFPTPSAIPGDRLFEAPVGSGKWYTDLDPTRAFFGEVAADVIPLDYFCWEEPDWTTNLIVPPGFSDPAWTPDENPIVPDGTTVEDAIGWVTQDIPITGTLALGGGRFRVTLDPHSGTGDSFTVVADGVELFDAGFTFTPNMVGSTIVIAGSTTPANDGAFLVTAYVGPNTIEFQNPAAVTEAYAGAWSLERTLFPVVGIGYWFAEFLGTPGSEAYLETLPVNLGGGVWEFEAIVGAGFVFGATVDISYRCHNALSCDYCRASVLRIEIVPVEVLTDPESNLENALPRITKKILDIVPIHVRVTDLIHIIGPVDAVETITISTSVVLGVTAPASVGYYYDIVTGDILGVDPDHIAVTATAFTVP